MAFPRLTMSGYWLYLVGGIVMIASFFAPQGAQFGMDVVPSAWLAAHAAP